MPPYHLLLLPFLVVGPAESPHEKLGAGETAINVEWEQLKFDCEDKSNLQRSQIPWRILRLSGKRIRIRGYFVTATVFKQHGIERFILAGEIKTKDHFKLGTPKNKWSRLPPLLYLAAVEMVDGKSADFTMGPIAVTGRFAIEIREHQGEAIVVYRFVAESVEKAPDRDGYMAALYGGC